MRTIVTIVLLGLLIAAPALAADSPIRIRTTPLASPTLTLEQNVVGRPMLSSESQPEYPVQPLRIATTLNCESDNIINLGNTLVIGNGDLAGTVFAAPVTPSPFHIKEVILGLVDFGQTYPATLTIELYEDDGATFNFLIGFTVDITTNPGSGALYSFDISSFNVQASGDILTLYGDSAPSEFGLMLPTGDDSPRCFDGSNVCSVHLPAGSGTLFIYGLTDPVACPRAPNNILNLDLTHELIVDEVAVATEPSSWGAVKSEFE